MLTTFSLIFLIGSAAGALCKRMKIPHIIGMLLTGIILGPYVLNFFDVKVLGISAELRQIALIIILIKAGLSLNISDLKRVGRPALLMSFIPASFEIAGIVIFGPMILGMSYTEAAITGAVLGAVSPAVVVPKMVELTEKKYGTAKSIPQMILAGASLDDAFVIVMFTTFCGIEQGGSAKAVDFINIPVSVIVGIGAGAAVGFLLARFFDFEYRKNRKIRNSTKAIIILGISFLLVSVEDSLKGIVAMSGLLAVMSSACVLRMYSPSNVGRRLSDKFGKLWIAAGIVLFVLVGAAVDIRFTAKAGLGAVGLIFIGLAFRSIGVLVCLIKTKLTFKERLFCVISYLPKATVQAAIGSVPLALGLPCGQTVLSVAVLSIIITAPLGAAGMDLTYKHLLTKEE